jgi:multiple sugar transport system permease protein
VSVAAEPAAAATERRATRGRKSLDPRTRSERKLAYMLCAPAVLAMVAVTAYPIGYALWLSLQRSDLRFPDDREFVGLSNYISVLSSGTWWSVLGNTVIITVVSVAIELVLGLMLAMVMHRAIFGRSAVRASSLVPYGIITVVAALAWQFMFTPDTGFLPGISNAALLADQQGQFIAVITTEVWKTTPFMALLILSGLALIPEDLYEAARTDGASASQRFRYITLPMIKPALLVALLFRTVDAFRVFDSAFILTGGNLRTVSILGYDTLITRLNLGIGSAVSVLIFLCVVIIAYFFVRGLGVSGAQQRGEAA